MDNTNTTHPHSHSEGGEHHSHESHKDHSEAHSSHDHHEMVSQDQGPAMDPAFRRRMIKIGLIAAGVLVLLALLFSLKSLLFAAIVDGQPVTRWSVISQLERQSGKEVLEDIVDRTLIANEAKDKNINITKEEIDEELKKFEEQFSAGGQSLDSALEAQNMTRDELRDQILIRKQIEKILADRVTVTDEDLNAYLAEGQVQIPAGEEDQTKNQVRDYLRQQKLAQLSGDLLKELHAKAKIYTFVEYRGGSAHDH